MLTCPECATQIVHALHRRGNDPDTRWPISSTDVTQCVLYATCSSESLKSPDFASRTCLSEIPLLVSLSCRVRKRYEPLRLSGKARLRLVMSTQAKSNPASGANELDPRDAVLRYMLARIRPGERRKTFLPVISLVQRYGRAAANAATPATLPQGFALGSPHDEPRVYKSNFSGTSALHWLCLHGKGQYVALLVARGANVHRVDVNGRTAIMTACGSGCMEAVRTLLLNGARVNGTCDKGYNSLLLAVLKGSLEVTQMLLEWASESLTPRELEAFVNARLSTGYTALAVAARGGNMKIVKLLVAHGAHHTVTYDGESVVEVATRYGHREVADWLISLLMTNSSHDSRHSQLLHREVRPGELDEYGVVETPVAL
jgi:Ankyrin repeats (3 copies)